MKKVKKPKSTKFGVPRDPPGGGTPPKKCKIGFWNSKCRFLGDLKFPSITFFGGGRGLWPVFGVFFGPVEVPILGEKGFIITPKFIKIYKTTKKYNIKKHLFSYENGGV